MSLSEHGLWSRITSKAKKGGLISNRIRLSEEGELPGPAEDVIGIPAIEIDGLNGQQSRMALPTVPFGVTSSSHPFQGL